MLYKYLVRADAAGVNRHLSDRMGNDKVEALLFSPLAAGLAERRTASGGR